MNERTFYYIFFTLGPTVLITRRSIMRYDFNKCSLYAAYISNKRWFAKIYIKKFCLKILHEERTYNM